MVVPWNADFTLVEEGSCSMLSIATFKNNPFSRDGGQTIPSFLNLLQN